MNNKNQIARPVAWAATNEEGNVEALSMNQSRRFDTPLYTAAQVQAMLAQGLAPGWKAVPVEPTRAMLDASIGVARNLSDWRNGLAAYRAMLATAPQPPAHAQEAQKPLTEDQIGAAARAAHVGFCLDKFQTFEHALVHFTEQAHGITAQQGGTND